MPGELLIGRDRERAAILDLLAGAGRRGAALVLEGAAGIGKSALLADARRSAAERGMLVLTTAGVQSEADLPFAGLHQLLRPLLAGLDDLPPPQREALRAAFGMAGGPPPAPFLIALGALGLISDAGAARPLLLSVEDAQWLDRPTEDALAFVGRRVESDAVVLIAAIREGYESALRDAGLPALRVERLTDEAARRLLDEHAPELSPMARGRLLSEAEGNPLALRELAVAIGAGAGAAGAAPITRMPLTERLEQAFAARAAELPAATRALLSIAAADEDTSVATALAAGGIAAGAALTLADLVPATDAKLVEVDGERLRFCHPLMRSAIYGSATPADRHAAHRALAEVLADDPNRRAWHRAAAAVGPDPSVAADLEDAGRRALRRGAITTAAAAFERAAALTDDDGHRGRLMLAAAATVGELGHGDAVTRLLRQLEPLELGPCERAQRMLIEDGFRGGSAGDPARVRELAQASARAADEGARDLALDLLVPAASRCYWADMRDEGRAVVAAADALGADPGDSRLLFVQVFGAPTERGAAVLDQARSSVPPDDALALYLRAMAVCLAGAFDQALPLLGSAAQTLREQGRVRMLAQVRSIQAWAALEVADFAVAVPAAEEASRLADEHPHPLWETGAVIAQATLAALRGDRAEVEARTAHAERAALPVGATALLSLVQYARGLLELGHGRHAEAYQQLRRVFEPGDQAHHHLTACHAIGDLAEAAAHSGHGDAVRELVDELEAVAGRARSPWFDAQVLLARVQLGACDGAEQRFTDALARDLTSWPMIRARIELAHGEWLRRHRRRRESRAPLRAARDAFDALGVHPWAERARRELRASGETSRRRRRDAFDELTPQELQIVQLAAQGLSNRDIAQQLYLSHRTVESHLYRVFPKLGVTSRGQLVSALGTIAAR